MKRAGKRSKGRESLTLSYQNNSTQLIEELLIEETNSTQLRTENRVIYILQRTISAPTYRGISLQ